MPPKSRITREMILDATFAICREQGAEQLSVRAVAARLGCSTQPVMYHFDRVEDLRRAVWGRADEYQTAYLMHLPEDGDPLLAIGLNYVRFAAEEKRLFRFLSQSDFYAGQSITALADAPELSPVLDVMQREAGLTADQARRVCRTLAMLVHGCASLLANNAMAYDEREIVPMLETALTGMIAAMSMEEEQA